ncbi:MAG: 23S rRNA (adenine(2030)-N(6))-methyltransferase RlmJ [Pseudomonadota bacterium]
MNYRHIYHAGNFADIFKHLVLHMVLGYLQEKDKGLMVLDAFAGTGLYDLTAFEPKKTKEFMSGVGPLMQRPAENVDIKTFQSFIEPDWKRQYYMGSPLIAAHMLRPQDRLIVNELHPDDNESLQKNVVGFKNVHVTKRDAYEVIRGNIPPTERRGLILIDPPFENPEEFELLVQQMAEWKRRWPTGCYIIWYPIKAGRQVDNLHNAAADLGLNRTWVSEYLLQHRDTEGSLNGCGLLVFNTPYGIPERVDTLAAELGKLIGEGWIESQFLTSSS